MRDDECIDALRCKEGRFVLDGHALEGRVSHELARVRHAHLTVDVDCGQLGVTLHVVLVGDACRLRDDECIDALRCKEGRFHVDRHAIESRVRHELARSCNAHLTLDECSDGQLGVALHVVLGRNTCGLRDDECIGTLRGEVDRLVHDRYAVESWVRHELARVRHAHRHPITELVIEGSRWHSSSLLLVRLRRTARIEDVMLRFRFLHERPQHPSVRVGGRQADPNVIPALHPDRRGRRWCRRSGRSHDWVGHNGVHRRWCRRSGRSHDWVSDDGIHPH